LTLDDPLQSFLYLVPNTFLSISSLKFFIVFAYNSIVRKWTRLDKTWLHVFLKFFFLNLKFFYFVTPPDSCPNLRLLLATHSIYLQLCFLISWIYLSFWLSLWLVSCHVSSRVKGKVYFIFLIHWFKSIYYFVHLN
jgi:hypothetical protein